MDPEIAAVVVNYNGGDHLTNCVRSIRAAGIDTVVVVDNGSTDGSPARLASIDHATRVLLTGANLGYGGGANWGVAATAAPFLLILNADAIVDKEGVVAMADALVSRVLGRDRRSAHRRARRIHLPVGTGLPGAAATPSATPSSGSSPPTTRTAAATS